MRVALTGTELVEVIVGGDILEAVGLVRGAVCIQRQIRPVSFRIFFRPGRQHAIGCEQQAGCKTALHEFPAIHVDRLRRNL